MIDGSRANVVVAHGLVKRYADAEEAALNGLSFHVGAGECFGFLGPNGAGKTTTMRLLTCQARRDDGELSIFGMDPDIEDRQIKRQLGVVPQATNLDSMLTLSENLAVHAAFFDMTRRETAARVRHLLDFVRLSARADWHVDALSGGMRRRALIARALINSPRLLLLDEPTGGLDPQARALVWTGLEELKRSGVSLVLSTHQMEEAARLCDRVAIVNDGVALMTDTPEHVVGALLPSPVFEVTGVDEATAASARRDLDGRWEFECAGAPDRWLLYSSNGSTGLDAIAGLETARPGVRVTRREPTLEDAFFKLAGRSLRE